MIRSMTGYSSGEVAFGTRRLAIEIRTVNTRFLDVSVKMPRTFLTLENEIKKLVAAHISRGKVEVTIQYAGQKNNGDSIQFDVPQARQICEQLRSLKTEVGLAGDVDVATLALFKDYFVREGDEPLDSEQLWQTLQPCLEQVLCSLKAMQAAECAAMAADLNARLEDIAGRVAAITARAATSCAERLQALRERVKSLCDGIAVDEQRMLQEIALLADRSDITEELVRIKSHLTQFRTWLASTEAVGKRLDFLVQELYREVNTMGSKAADAEISAQVIAIKNELEKIREQVQNVM